MKRAIPIPTPARNDLSFANFASFAAFAVKSFPRKLSTKAAWIESMQKLVIKTCQKREILDITDKVEAALSNSTASTGICNLLVLHTTAALTTADLDPGTDLDMLDAFEQMIPKRPYRHPHDPAHVPDHILSALIGTSIVLPFEKNSLLLGTWQRVVLVELDGPRVRELVVTITSEK
jgi:secondary thiamine-phosphate synthase enzyme